MDVIISGQAGASYAVLSKTAVLYDLLQSFLRVVLRRYMSSALRGRTDLRAFQSALEERDMKAEQRLDVIAIELLCSSYCTCWMMVGEDRLQLAEIFGATFLENRSTVDFVTASLYIEICFTNTDTIQAILSDFA